MHLLRWDPPVVPVVAETGEKLEQTGACLLWWESLPVSLEAEAGLWVENL